MILFRTEATSVLWKPAVRSRCEIFKTTICYPQLGDKEINNKWKLSESSATQTESREFWLWAYIVWLYPSYESSSEV